MRGTYEGAGVRFLIIFLDNLSNGWNKMTIYVSDLLNEISNAAESDVREQLSGTTPAYFIGRVPVFSSKLVGNCIGACALGLGSLKY